MTQLKKSLLATLITPLLLATSAHAQEYKIKLSRAAKVNDQYTTKVTGSVKQSTQVTANGQAQPKTDDNFTFDLQGEVKVLSVGEKYPTATRLTCKIAHLTKDGTDVYPNGTVITAELADGKTNYSIDGSPVDPKNMQLLAAVLNLNDAEKSGSDDEIVGTDKPQPVGASWSINPQNLSKAMAAGGLPIDAADLKGESKLARVSKMNDTDVMQVTTVATSDGFKINLPQGVAISEGKLKVEVTEVLPVDTAMPGTSYLTRTQLSMTVTTPQGSQVVIVDRVVDEKHELVKQ